MKSLLRRCGGAATATLAGLALVAGIVPHAYASQRSTRTNRARASALAVVPTGPNAPPGCYPKLNPQGQPKYVAIIVGGIGSTTGGGSYDPLDFAVGSNDRYAATNYCISHPGSGPWHIASEPAPVGSALNYFLPHPDVGTSLTNSLVNAGALLLPFSYTGAVLSSRHGQPWMAVTYSSTSEPGDVLPPNAAAVMQTEVASVRAMWPAARIVVVGHSEGGLVAETWWDEHGASAMPSASGRPGVVGVFSMDAPLNGLSTGGACGLEKFLTDRFDPILGSICQLAHVSSTLGSYYTHLWATAPARDSELEHLSASEHNMYVPIGSEYDPVYYLLGAERAGDDHGLASQVLYHWAHRASSGSIVPIGKDLAPSYLTTCYAGTGVTWTMLTNALQNIPAAGLGIAQLEYDIATIGAHFIDAHGVVINCPSTIGYVRTRLLGDNGGWFAPPAPTPTPSLPPPTGVTGAVPGYGSPDAAAAGILHAVLVDHNYSGICSYVVPDQQSACSSAALFSAGTYATGYAKITADAVQGNLALVAYTGKICETGSGCGMNSDPYFGLPHTGLSFQSAYKNAAVSAFSATTEWGAIPCLEVYGLWYVNLGI